MKRIYNILLHFAFWVLFAIMPLSTLFFSDQPLPLLSVVYIVSVYLLHILNFYVAYFVLVPLLFRKKKVLIYVFGSLAFVLVFALIRLLIIKTFFHYIHIPLDADMTKFLSNPYNMLFEYIVHSFVFTAYAFLLRSTFEWFGSQKQKSELINQNQASELALLRYQINPHFLFNTLNNIYSLVYKKDEKAPGAVMKLSEILHYTLYKANTEMVQLDNEIGYLKSFIELQSLRVTDANFVQFDVQGNTAQRTIVPMLLLPFVENAFKHCDKQVASPGIVIRIKINENDIEFFCKNYLTSPNPYSTDDVGGIGLQNIKRRIELLYPKKHELYINTSETEFVVYLKLQNK
ncbi:MAG: histidine kinase [Bacteroidota bacterium]